MARILVIDDDDNVRRMIRKILERDGHELMEAPNGEIGTKLYRENPTDLIITDIFMPEKEGLETIIELRKDFPGVKIVAISGGGCLNTETTLLLAGMFGALRTIPKPIPKEELVAAVNDLLKKE